VSHRSGLGRVGTRDGRPAGPGEDPRRSE